MLPKRWYAVELIGDDMPLSPDGGFARSPIRVDSVTPRKSGKRLFELAFYHANYPEGVRDKVYSLETIERGERFILAKSTEHDPVRMLLIHELTHEWLRTYCKIGPANPGDDVQVWCSRNC